MIHCDGNRRLLSLYSSTQRMKHLQKPPSSKCTPREFSQGCHGGTTKRVFATVKLGKAKCPTIRNDGINPDASGQWDVHPLQTAAIRPSVTGTRPVTCFCTRKWGRSASWRVRSHLKTRRKRTGQPLKQNSWLSPGGGRATGSRFVLSLKYYSNEIINEAQQGLTWRNHEIDDARWYDSPQQVCLDVNKITKHPVGFQETIFILTLWGGRRGQPHTPGQLRTWILWADKLGLKSGFLPVCEPIKLQAR